MKQNEYHYSSTTETCRSDDYRATIALGLVLEIIGLVYLLVNRPGTLNTGSIIFDIVFAILGFVIVWGLWTLHKWAFIATIVLDIIGLASNGAIFINGNHSTTIIITLLVELAILIYLFADPHVRTAFHYDRSAAAYQ